MYVLKITCLFLVIKLSLANAEEYLAPASFDLSSEAGRAAELTAASISEELRSHPTEPYDVVSIGYTKHKPGSSSETRQDLKSTSNHYDGSTPFPVGYDQQSSTQANSHTQAEFKLSSPSSNYESYSTPPPPLPSQYLETTLSPPVFEHYTTPAKYHSKKEDYLYQPTRSPLLNHQSTPVSIQHDSYTTGTSAPTGAPSLDYKGTPAPLPPQYNPIAHNSQQSHSSPALPPHSYAPGPHSYFSTPPPLPQQYDFPSQSPPVPYNFISQLPPVPPQYQPSALPYLGAYSAHGPYTPASSSIHSTTTVTPHGEIGTTTPSVYDYSTVAPLQPQYDFIRENYENIDASQSPPAPQGYDHISSLSPPLPPQYGDPSPYLSLPNSPNYLENIYRPYSTPLRKHNPSPSFEFNPTPHNPTHYIHNIPHYLTPSYDAYTQAPHPNGGHPHYYKPLYNPYNPSIPQIASGFQPYAAQHYASHVSPQLTQYENYNSYPTIYRPPVPPNYQPHLPPKSHTTLYHVQASKELNPPESPSSSTEKTFNLKEAREYKNHGYHNYQVTEKSSGYSVEEG